MSYVTVEMPEELLADIDRHVGPNRRFVDRSEAVGAAIDELLDRHDDVDGGLNGRR